MSDHNKGEDVFKQYISSINIVIIKEVIPIIKKKYVIFNEYQELTNTLKILESFSSDEKIEKAVKQRSHASDEIDDINFAEFKKAFNNYQTSMIEMANKLLSSDNDTAIVEMKNAKEHFLAMCCKGYDDSAAKSILGEITGKRKREIENIINTMHETLQYIQLKNDKLCSHLFEELSFYLKNSARR